MMVCTQNGQKSKDCVSGILQWQRAGHSRVHSEDLQEHAFIHRSEAGLAILASITNLPHASMIHRSQSNDLYSLQVTFQPYVSKRHPGDSVQSRNYR